MRSLSPIIPHSIRWLSAVMLAAGAFTVLPLPPAQAQTPPGEATGPGGAT